MSKQVVMDYAEHQLMMKQISALENKNMEQEKEIVELRDKKKDVMVVTHDGGSLPNHISYKGQHELLRDHVSMIKRAKVAISENGDLKSKMKLMESGSAIKQDEQLQHSETTDIEIKNVREMVSMREAIEKIEKLSVYDRIFNIKDILRSIKKSK